MVFIESIIATTFSGFILKEVAQAHVRKYGRKEDCNSVASEKDVDYHSQQEEIPTDENYTVPSSSCNQSAHLALIDDGTGISRHAILFDGIVKMDLLTTVDIQDINEVVFKISS